MSFSLEPSLNAARRAFRFRGIEGFLFLSGPLPSALLLEVHFLNHESTLLWIYMLTPEFCPFFTAGTFTSLGSPESPVCAADYRELPLFPLLTPLLSSSSPTSRSPGSSTHLRRPSTVTCRFGPSCGDPLWGTSQFTTIWFSSLDHLPESVRNISFLSFFFLCTGFSYPTRSLFFRSGFNFDPYGATQET